jgi:hypothetical protein
MPPKAIPPEKKTPKVVPSAQPSKIVTRPVPKPSRLSGR